MPARQLVPVLAAFLALCAPATAAPTHYVPVSDGVEIALNVKVPDKCWDDACPTFFEMSGYESGSDEGKTPLGHLADATGVPFPLQTGTRAAHAAYFEDDYVTVLASVRGTGCSTGEFDVFSRRSAEDGREIIDNWIASQPWSNGEVLIFGHSYSGLTGMMVAATRPVHLKAVTASGLFGDVYRDIVYPGGVANYGFPLLWTGAVRPVYDYGGGTIGGVYPVEETSAECAANQAERSRTVTEEPLVHGLDDTDGEWYRARSLIDMVDRIEVPVHITAAYQDEQTGPRGPTHVFDHLPDTISKRLVLVNGVHGTQTAEHIRKDRFAWAHYWMRGIPTADLGFAEGTATLSGVFGPRDVPTTTSRVILGYQGAGRAAGDIASDGFPLAQTQFTDLYAAAGGKLVEGAPPALPGTATWINGSRRQSYTYQAGVKTGWQVSTPSGPDEVELAHTFTQPTVIAGPITANLFVSSSAPDTELFVQLIDRGPDGTLTYLNRGMLRGSHNAVDAARSQWFKGRNYRPWRPHEARALATPGAVVDYLVDVYPVGHVFRAGHQLVVKIHAPPAEDNDYAYIQKTLAGVNTLHFGPKAPTRITLPAIPLSAVRGFAPPDGACPWASMRCITP